MSTDNLRLFISHFKLSNGHFKYEFKVSFLKWNDYTIKSDFSKF